MQNTLKSSPLNDDELDRLEAFIFSDVVSEDSLDLIGIHGFLCALNISPRETEQSEWLNVLFDGEPNWVNDQQRDDITSLLIRWKNTIRSDLYNDCELDMPCDLSLEPNENDDVELEIWAQAFMEGVFLNEEEWFSEGTDKEESVAELMLPIMVASVASGIPRLDYYTSGGVTGCPALLVEPAATNLALHSRDLTNAKSLFSK